MTAQCHLCELAIQELEMARKSLGQPFEWEEIEIAYDDALVMRYGTTIPVLKRLDSEQELLWPFTAQQVSRFLG